MRKLSLVILVMLVVAGLYARTEAPIQDRSPITTTTTAASDDLWDVLLSFDVDTPSGQVGLAGMGWDGTYFYAHKWSASNQTFQFDAAGNYIGAITLPLTGCRDSAFDGTYMYGSPATSSVSCWDPPTGTANPAGNINVAGASVRAIAYDPVTDTFWSGNWGDNIVNWNRSGTILNSYPWAGSLYGLAYDNDPNGPYIYAHSQDPGCNVYRLDPNANLAQLATYDATGLGAAGAIAGGAQAMTDWDPQYRTLALLLQGSPDYIVVLELDNNLPLDAPGAPTDVAVIPDAGGALEALVTWTCPSLTVGGAALTDLDEMRVYRDGTLIYTDTNPSIGGPGTYNDIAVPSSDTYTYTVVGFNNEGEGIPVNYSTWVGEDVPAAVDNLLLEQTSPGALSGTLTWDNPTGGLNGGAFNNPILGYHIVRYPDNVPIEVAGSATSYVDGTIPIAGVYYYTVQPYNSIGDGGTAESNAVLIADAGLLIMEDFSGTWPPAGWTTSGGTNWIQGTGNNAGGEAPEAEFYWSPSTVALQRLITMPVNTSGFDELQLEFKHALSYFSASFTIGVQTTSDGTTWNTAWDMTVTANINATTETIDINTPDVGSPNFQMCFFFDGDSWDINNWWIDDVMLTGAGAGPDPGTIEGNVVLNGGTGNVTDVTVTAGGVTANPDASGNYVITIAPGTYDVTASLAGYDPETVEDVVVTEGNATTGIDFVLNPSTVPLDPPTNLAVDEDTGLFTWDAPGTGQLFELIQHDGNPQNAYYQAYDNGYGVVYDVSGWTNVTVEMVDFRHSSWGVYGTWDYSIHIVDWDTHTEIAEVGVLQTTGNDIWEEEINLGSVPVSGLVGIFMEPMGNSAADAYPCLDSDDVGPDGLSYFGPLANYAGMELSGIGDFLMDLWIMGVETDGAVKAPRVAAEFGNGASRLESSVPSLNFITLEQSATGYSRELQSYNVYLGDTMVGNTDDTEWMFTDLINGQTYTAGVEAVYDEGISDLVTIDFTYTGTEAGSQIIAKNELTGNYPNPFNPSTTIAFNLAEPSQVIIEVYNIKGEKVKTLVDGEYAAASHTITWNGDDNSGKSVSSGVYFYKMKAGSYTSTRKMILMK